MQVAKQSGQMLPELEAPSIPLAGADLYKCVWDVFSRTDTTKWQNLYYYSKYTGDWFSSEELSILSRLFNAMDDEIRKVSKSS